MGWLVYTGLRPGEKLYEELYFDDERRVSTKHPKVFCAMHRPADMATVEAMFEELSEVIDESPEAVRARLRDVVPEYSAEAGGEPAAPQTEEMRKARAK